MENSGKSYLWGTVSVLAAFLIGALVSGLLVKGHFRAELETLTPEVIEYTKTDTIVQIKPTFVERRIVKKDTIKIAVIDTLVVRDTLYLPREQKVYADSSYRAVVSGISPRLDSIKVYNKTITKIATQKEWRKFDYGVQVGVGLVCPVNSTPNFGFYTGFGVTYHF
jgi:hypothetical protein